MVPTKQETKRVEWYYGDFSDPEAVSGSSTNNIYVKQENGHEGSFFLLVRSMKTVHGTL